MGPESLKLHTESTLLQGLNTETKVVLIGILLTFLVGIIAQCVAIWLKHREFQKSEEARELEFERSQAQKLKEYEFQKNVILKAKLEETFEAVSDLQTRTLNSILDMIDKDIETDENYPKIELTRTIQPRFYKCNALISLYFPELGDDYGKVYQAVLTAYNKAMILYVRNQIPRSFSNGPEVNEMFDSVMYLLKKLKALSKTLD